MSRVRFATLVVAATASALVASGCASGSGGDYGYGAGDIRQYKTVLLVPEAHVQPQFEYADELAHYLMRRGIECPVYREDYSFGSDVPSRGQCYRADSAALGATAPIEALMSIEDGLYRLRTFDSSDDKRDHLGGTTHNCESKLKHEYWVEGPNWYVEVHDLDVADRVQREASTRRLALAMAESLGARLYRAC